MEEKECNLSPTVSIVITSFNREGYIARAIRSCLDQILFAPITFEIIVVDDGSTDNSLELLHMFSEQIKLVKHEVNKGVAAATNSGIRAAAGDYIIRLDADDFLNRFSIYMLAQILEENPKIGFVYTDHFRVDEKGYKQEKVTLDTDEKIYDHGAGIMFRREIFDNVGPYDEFLRNCEDFDFFARVMSSYKGFHFPLPLYRYNIHGENLSLTEDRMYFKKIVRERHGL
jgi:glycosyltransferase involved in cell wall biosynthesis